MSAEEDKGPLETEVEELIRFELTGIQELQEAYKRGRKKLRFPDPETEPLLYLERHIAAQQKLVGGLSKALKRIAQEIDRLNGS
jgi:hypothetical protein